MLLQVAIDQPSDLYLVVGLAEVADIVSAPHSAARTESR